MSTQLGTQKNRKITLGIFQQFGQRARARAGMAPVISFIGDHLKHNYRPAKLVIVTGLYTYTQVYVEFQSL